MSRKPLPNLSTNPRGTFKGEPPDSSQDDQDLCSSGDSDDECMLCTTECTYLNCNDLGPKADGSLANIFLTFGPSFKKSRKHIKSGHRIKSSKIQTPAESNKMTSEMETNEELSEDSKLLLCSYVFRDIIGSDHVYLGPFGRNFVTYLDYVASGRPLRCIELYIRHNVMPTYSNTHTEVNYVAQQTTRLREEARDIIRECVNATQEDVVIFTGSGATAAVNKLIHAMDISSLTKDLNLIVFVGPYEHHSNILPWREVASKVVTIRQTEQGLIDLENLTLQLETHTKCSCSTKHLLIGSFSAASNVTGIITDVNTVASLMHTYGGYAFFDYACAAPYTEIDMNPKEPQAFKDAVFISPHKFIGGPQTPGILVAKRWVFRNPVPHGVGGGTVVFVRRTAHSYSSDLEHREEGGTPGIIESIRAGLVFKLKAAFTPQFIIAKERELFRAARAAWSRLPNLLILGNLCVDRLPIFPMLFLNPRTGRLLHHDFVARIINDIFGIQVRSGCACAGPYGMDLLGMKESVGEVFERLITVKPKHSDSPPSSCIRAKNIIFKPGFVRLNFPYFIPADCVNFVLKAIEMTSEKGWVLLPLYDYDRDSGRWWYRLKTDSYLNKSLNDVTFKSGKFGIKRSSLPDSGETQDTASSKEKLPPQQASQGILSEECSYDEILARAEVIFSEAERLNLPDMSDNSLNFTVEEESLRWFMLPSEAAAIINKKQVRRVLPDDLPFLPSGMREKFRCSRQH